MRKLMRHLKHDLSLVLAAAMLIGSIPQTSLPVQAQEITEETGISGNDTEGISQNEVLSELDILTVSGDEIEGEENPSEYRGSRKIRW